MKPASISRLTTTVFNPVAPQSFKLWLRRMAGVEAWQRGCGRTVSNGFTARFRGALQSTRCNVQRIFGMSAILLFLQSTLHGEDNLPQLVEHLAPSVVSLHVVSADGAESRGTGFFVGVNGEVATNYHVVEGARRITAKTSKGLQLFANGVLTLDADSDLALLKFGAKDLPAVSLADPAQILKGEPVLVIGSPQGLDQSVSNGIVSAIRTEGSWEQIQITAPISKGSSGSPIVNMKGEVVGVATFGLVGGQALNFASSVKHLRGMVDGLKNLEITSFSDAFPNERSSTAGSQTRPEPASSTPEPPSVTDKAAGLKRFWSSYWASQLADDPVDWAKHFADSSDYQYVKGKATRDDLVKSSQELTRRYPDRKFHLQGDPSIVPLKDASSRIGFDYSFSYSYQNKIKTVSGTSHVELALQWTGLEWEIYKFRERVERK